ncbi:MAG TPA: UDP-3-O-acyl-N-acetylglucosamine deacetylase [Halanaerobiales bacterium]|nr:UDP-3-O-acyl-N-acetylglucosamine deacetylase [Halanaerobiales bacterium]HPZ62477.1 UDP-3-O-acyl-N-acetylglucosamine deacetylase [Halanaerobiales bacterium]HQD03641.1 UDP-3-O-acyl-N-acetylglucosamine deacetylase [Halanaerobiales bacterium]
MFAAQSLQKTIARPLEYSGIALHTGKEVKMRCLPAEANSGVIFRRVDLGQEVEIKAEPGNVVSSRRCTSIGLKEDPAITVHTIEHLMAALWASDIDNIIIELDNPETPVADGSALPYIELIQEIGVKELREERKILKVEEALWVEKGDMYLVILPYDGFKVSYTLVYDHPVIGTQFAEYEQGLNDFIKEIAPARTFGFEREVVLLHKRGLALGGSLDNAVLVADDRTVNPLRFSDEFVRHKIMDLVGDMFLNGFIAGHIIAVRSGHYLHVELARKIHEKHQQK